MSDNQAALNAQDGRRVLLGVTGGIAAYKSVELASLLVKAGYDVRVVMTKAARWFVGPGTFAAITGNPVHHDMFDPAQENTISHIDLARWADLVCVAPATANFIAKAACGLADDLLTTVLLATDAPLILAPAMNPHMYAHVTVGENLARLKARGAVTVGPDTGRTACGEEGPGRMSEPQVLAETVEKALSPAKLRGVKVVVSAGPTREHLDPVRYLSNPSTGRMGLEIARAAALLGAEVSLILGPTHLAPPRGVKTVDIVSAAQMREAVLEESLDAKVVIKAAAVSDFAPKECAPQKVKKSGNGEVCEFTCTPDILAELGSDKGERILVGFAAETENLRAHAKDKLARKNLDLLVANDVSRSDSGFAVETNRVQIFFAGGGVEILPLMSKRDVALKLMRIVSGLLEKKDA